MRLVQTLTGGVDCSYDAAVIEAGENYYILYVQLIGGGARETTDDRANALARVLQTVTIDDEQLSAAPDDSEKSTPQADAPDDPEHVQIANKTAAFSLHDVPDYSGEATAEVNGNEPYFTDAEMTTTAFKRFPGFDDLGRCGTATACLGPETIPNAKRESIGMIRPSGWHTVKYEGIGGKYLYNRCHLIGYQLCGENANERNLITGTRYMNTQGMEPYESATASYIEGTGNHVLYRVTPVFEAEDLVAKGVLMEARSVENDDYAFCVFCYNVQPGIVIDYATGESRLEGEL